MALGVLRQSRSFCSGDYCERSGLSMECCGKAAAFVAGTAAAEVVCMAE